MILPVIARLGEIRVLVAKLYAKFIAHSAVAAHQVAGDAGFIFAASLKRAAVQAAAGDFHLRDGAVRANLDPLRAGLPGKLMAVGLPMIEHIPFLADLHNASVIVSRIVQRLRIRAAMEVNIAVGNDGAAIDEAVVGRVAGGVAQLVPVEG